MPGKNKPLLTQTKRTKMNLYGCGHQLPNSLQTVHQASEQPDLISLFRLFRLFRNIHPRWNVETRAFAAAQRGNRGESGGGESGGGEF
jgi:hypothetical protein